MLLVGGNAQGKSNLLEAAYMLCILRSHRAGAERELIRWGVGGEQPWARVLGRAQGGADELEIEVVIQQTASEAAAKRIRINGIPCPVGEAVGVFTGVLFSAEDIGLLGGPPALRRRYLDIIGCQLSGRYLRSLQRYHRVLAQRNSLLKLLAEGRSHAGELEFWDRELVAEGGYIRGQRQAFLEALNGLARDIHSELTEGREALELEYRPSPADPSPGALTRALEVGRGRELALGTTLSGPHRDELRFRVNGVDVGVFGSRGQQRTVALSLRLAEGRLLHRDRGQPPVLLLDDVLSELDGQRRSQLLGSVAPFDQWLLTTTDLSQVAPAFLEQASLFRIRGGSVNPVPPGANLLEG